MRERGFRTQGATFVLALLASGLASASDTSVLSAVASRDKAALRGLLKSGADVNAAMGDGLTALHQAALDGDTELAQLLIYAGANLKAATRLGGYTPLLLAAKQGDAPMVATLLKGGADPSQATTNGTSALMFAAASGQLGAVKALVEKGANVAARETAMGHTALTFAAERGRTEVVKYLLGQGADLKAATRAVDLMPFTEEARAAFAAAVAGGGAAPSPTPAASPAPAPAPASSPSPSPAPKKPEVAGVDRPYLYNEMVAATGGMSPLHLAVRQGHASTATALLETGADINALSMGDQTSPLLIAVINGHFDLALDLLERGADPRLASENGVTPLYAALNVQWAPKALYPQPRAYAQQKASHLDLMKALIAKGAMVDARLRKKVWYSGYNFDLTGVDETGATPFWRAAYASDVDAMKLLAAHGADPNLRTMKPAGRPRTGDSQREVKDLSGLPPVPTGGPAITALQAAAGAGYGEGFAANSHRFAPGGMLAAVKYLVEELDADVNAVDHEGNTALHHAAARGDNDMVRYLVSKGADVMAVTREGQTTVDMANAPVQRVEPFPATIALLESMGAKNNQKCVSCDKAAVMTTGDRRN